MERNNRTTYIEQRASNNYERSKELCGMELCYQALQMKLTRH